MRFFHARVWHDTCLGGIGGRPMPLQCSASLLMKAALFFGTFMSSPVRYIAVSLCAAACMTGMLVGCNAKEDSSKKSPSQVAVKVNKEEISVHQVNDLLARSGNSNLSPEQVGRARSAVVERLIDQELLLQQAKDNKLDRDPNVMQMIEFSRRDILARAYGERVMSGALQPTETEISKFYDEHPELFSKRRIYNLQELGIQVGPDRFDEVHTRVKESGGNLQQLVGWLNEQKIPVAANVGIKPAEQIPLEILKNLAKIEDGKGGMAFGRTPMGALLIIVTATRDEPVDRVRANPIIQRILLNQARNESLGAEIKRLRGVAAIDYNEGFSAPTAVAEPSASTGQSPVVPPDAAPEGSIQSIMEKEGAVKLK